MTRLCPLPEDGGLRSGRVAIEVDVGPGAITIVIRGELDLVTLPVLAGQLAVVAGTSPSGWSSTWPGRSFMDCGSARLIAGSGPWLRDGGRPVIRRPGPGVRRILGLTGLDATAK